LRIFEINSEQDDLEVRLNSQSLLCDLHKNE